jgi:hypothetical protein
MYVCINVCNEYAYSKSTDYQTRMERKRLDGVLRWRSYDMSGGRWVMAKETLLSAYLCMQQWSTTRIDCNRWLTSLGNHTDMMPWNIFFYCLQHKLIDRNNFDSKISQSNRSISISCSHSWWIFFYMITDRQCVTLDSHEIDRIRQYWLTSSIEWLLKVKFDFALMKTAYPLHYITLTIAKEYHSLDLFESVCHSFNI